MRYWITARYGDKEMNYGSAEGFTLEHDAQATAQDQARRHPGTTYYVYDQAGVRVGEYYCQEKGGNRHAY